MKVFVLQIYLSVPFQYQLEWKSFWNLKFAIYFSNFLFSCARENQFVEQTRENLSKLDWIRYRTDWFSSSVKFWHISWFSIFTMDWTYYNKRNKLVHSYWRNHSRDLCRLSPSLFCVCVPFRVSRISIHWRSTSLFIEWNRLSFTFLFGHQKIGAIAQNIVKNSFQISWKSLNCWYN